MRSLVVVTDAVMDDIQRLVAAHAPERGGALMGPVGQSVVTRYVHDSEARGSGSTFRPSQQLQRQVTAVESTDETLELKGILHSHPGAMNHPSSGDGLAYEDSLRGAPWLGRFVCPIVTGQPPASANEVGMPSGRASFFVAHATGRRSADVSEADVRVLPLRADAAALSELLGARAPGLGTVNVDGQVYLSAAMDAPGVSVQLLVGAGYPTDAPLLLVSRLSGAAVDGPILRSLTAGLPPGQTRHIPLAWSLEVAEPERLVTVVTSAGRGDETVPRRANPYGSQTAAPATVTEAARRGATPGAPGVSGDAEPADGTSDVSARQGIRARLTDVTSARIAGRHVLLVGCGSGGSLTAEMLVRSGVEHITLVDADTVSAANLSRSVYTLADVGQPKVGALARRLRSINPGVEVLEHTDRLQDLDLERVDEMVTGADLVIAATDDPNAQRQLNHFAYARGVPALFGGVYAKAAAGEVVFTVPGLTACYRCATSTRHVSEQAAPATDYGTGRLTGEPALGADIAHLVTASVKIAIGLLQVEDDDTYNPSRALLVDALTAQSNYLITSTVAAWDFFPTLFAEVPGQLAYQSVWLSSAKDPTCPVCCDEPVDPLTAQAHGPQVLNLRTVTPPPPAQAGVDSEAMGRS